MGWISSKPAEEQAPKIQIEGFRVLVRRPEENDWKSWSSIRAHNQEMLQAYEPTWADNCLSKSFFLRRCRRQNRDWLAGRAYSFIIVKKENLAIIGGINLNHVCRGAAMYASLGYWLDQAHQGQGYMAESLRLVIRYAFESIGLHRINAACLPDNEPSANLLLKLGFKEEGYANDYLQINGVWRDHRLFGCINQSLN